MTVQSVDTRVRRRRAGSAALLGPFPNPTPDISGDTDSASPRELPDLPLANNGLASENVSRLIARLHSQDLTELRQEWRRLYRAEPPRLSRDLMMRSLAYRIQEIAFGGLAKTTQRRLSTLVTTFESDGRIAAPAQPRIKLGARLVREWHGRTHTVSVADAGYEYEGRAYSSLTAIAREITGARWSGPRFFGLSKAAVAPAFSAASESVGQDGEGRDE